MLETNIKEFIMTAMNHEIQLAQTLFEQLSSEQTLLEKQAVDNLDSVLKQKAKLLDELEKSSTQRLGVLGIKPLLRNHNQLFEQQIAHDQGLVALWKKLAEIMFKCRTQNEINGRIIELSQKSLDRTLNIFKQSLRPNNLTTYSARGKAMQTPMTIASAKA
ncbi:MAG: flagellar protein FlgN [Gammaproteobacteria bacterium]|nr:flagellar protein FlgN [Gammaproteobacteria bacterium]